MAAADSIDAVELAIHSALFTAAAEEMGTILMRSAHSPNIKDRRDFSTALFTPGGRLLAQAAHIPVHLGSMGFALEGVRGQIELGHGDLALLNDPYLGGTHLPDITAVAPVHLGEQLIGWVANRAHHSDVGGATPGSMAIASRLEDEGLILAPRLLVRGGALDEETLAWILTRVRTPREREGDLRAQVAANLAGARRLSALVERLGYLQALAAMEAVLEHGRRIARATLAAIPDGRYEASQVLDDDGFGHEDVPIVCRVDIAGESAIVDFEGTAAQVEGNLNAVMPVTYASVAYCFRCLMPPETPSSAGCFEPLVVRAPEGSLLNPRRPAAVAAGNVETSQRVVDCVFEALRQALPGRIPAASSGSMNNVAIGGWDPVLSQPFGYYETLAGGMGARPSADGLDAVHTHMTNTLNTPVESLEQHYPLRILRYALREGSGGAGRTRGGRGIVRELQALADVTLSLLTERRRHAPPGAAGGSPGATGRNTLVTPDGEEQLPGKVTRTLRAGDRLAIETPGGGGHGRGEG